jgi:hypothetical protein
MDDLHFRRSIYADPNSRDEDIVAAQHQDPAKKQFAQEISQLDQKIKKALTVDVPDDLYNKLMLKQALASHQQQQRKNRVHLALAASVAFALGLSFTFLQSSSSYSDIGTLSLAHVQHEAPHFKQLGNAKISLASLNDKMADFHGQFTSTFGELVSAGYCNFGGIKSLHLVYQGQSGPVTVFVMPNEKGLSFTANFSNDSLKGQALHFDEANIVVVGNKNEPLKQWRDNIEKNIIWSI